MITYLIILGKASLAVVLFFLFYRLVLAKDKLFRRNRFYLVGAVLLSFIFPLITIPIFDGNTTQTLTIKYIQGSSPVISERSGTGIQMVSWAQVILFIYLTGVVISLFKMLIAYFQVYNIIKKAFHIPIGKLRLVSTSRNLSPFSFLHWIVIPEHLQKHPSYEKMVQHEMVHCRQYHSVDLFIAEILIFIQWFNPFAWLLRKAISENLEYLVDEEMLYKGTNARDYQYSLLSFSVVGLKSAVANNYSSNLLIKRITMMNTSKYSRNYRLHNFLIPVCLIFTMMLTASFQKQAKAQENLAASSDFKVVNQPDVLSAKELPRDLNQNTTPILSKAAEKETPAINYEEQVLGYIMNNIKYPKEAIDMNLQGVIEIPVKFESKGVEIPKSIISGERLKQVVVVAYASEETGKNAPVDANSPCVILLQDEVVRVLKAYPDVPKQLVGKTFIISVKFILEGMRDVEELGINSNTKLIIRNKFDIEPRKQTFILNNEKIISKEEVEKIAPETIQSVEVIKGEKFEHRTPGTINGSVIIISLKK
jgi:beta-lactamase regulating signal transducer with metallopeptidase domain